jgi:hypothetical protein
MRYLQLTLFLFVLVSSFFVSSATAQVPRVTSAPSGAVKVPGGYFHNTHTVFSAQLEHEMVLPVSL